MQNEFCELVKESKTIAIFAHMNPDGDACGSAMAMKRVLDGMHKQTFLFVPLPINQSYQFLQIDEFSCKKKAKSYDLAISLDCPNTKRFGQCEPEFFKANKTINIDHHIDNQNFADVNIVEPKRSSACELLFFLFEKSNFKIDKDIATCLYSGIATDTGGFLYSSSGDVSIETWQTVVKLVKAGAELSKINYNLFIKLRKPVFEIFRKGLNALEYYADGKIAIVCIDKKMLADAHAELTDTYKITNLVNGIEGVEIAVIVTQKSENENAVSVRSNKHSAQRICSHFGGGGHLRASGCKIFAPLIDAKTALIKECEEELKRND